MNKMERCLIESCIQEIIDMLFYLLFVDSVIGWVSLPLLLRMPLLFTKPVQLIMLEK